MVKSVLIAHPASRKVVLVTACPLLFLRGYGLARRVILIWTVQLQALDFPGDHTEGICVVLGIPAHDRASHQVGNLDQRLVVRTADDHPLE